MFFRIHNNQIIVNLNLIYKYIRTSYFYGLHNYCHCYYYLTCSYLEITLETDLSFQIPSLTNILEIGLLPPLGYFYTQIPPAMAFPAKGHTAFLSPYPVDNHSSYSSSTPTSQYIFCETILTI